jgi:PAS domain S-box-containing protein
MKNQNPTPKDLIKEIEKLRCQLEEHVKARTQELQEANDRLKSQICEHEKLEQELRDREEIYRSIFDNSLDGILLTAPNGAIFAANRAACEMLGRTEKEICEGGRTLTVDETDPRLPKILEERAHTGRFLGELNHRRKDGTIFPVEFSSTVFTSANGELRSNIILRDITERKKSEQALKDSEERLALAMRATENAVWDLELTSNTIYRSPNWWSMIGYKDNELKDDIGLWFSLMHAEDLEAARSVIRKAMAEGIPSM